RVLPGRCGHRARARGGKDPAMSGEAAAATTKKQWFVVHTYSGFENKVAEAIQSRAKIFGMGEKIAQVLVPTEKVVEVRNKQKRETEQKFFPGYVLVEMELTDDTWHLVRSTPKVTGFWPEPTKPVTFGVERTRCQVSSVSSISTSTYPGKNFCSVSRFCLLRTSTTFSVGTRTRLIFSPMPKILARDWMASETLFSNPEYVWTTNHCLFVVVASPLISDSFPSAAQNPLDRPGQHDVDRAQEERQHH